MRVVRQVTAAGRAQFRGRRRHLVAMHTSSERVRTMTSRSLLTTGSDRALTPRQVSRPHEPARVSHADLGPELTPDGSRIAFIGRVGKRGGNTFEICVMNAGGTNLVQLTDNDLFEGTMTWSPDGHEVIYSRARESESKSVLRYRCGHDLRHHQASHLFPVPAVLGSVMPA
jgi:hypothetical protein